MIPKKIQDTLKSWAPRWHPGRFRATLAAMAVLAVVVPIGLLAIPYLDIFNEMAVQPKAKAQGTYGWFSDHQELVAFRQPVPGTIPMSGWMPYPIQGNDDASRKLASETLKGPEPVYELTKNVGQKWFNVFCITCHGPEGDGNGKIVGPNLFPAPPSLHTEQARKFAEGHIFHVITAGQNKMPSYADRLTPEQRWRVVHYVKAMQEARKMAEEDAK